MQIQQTLLSIYILGYWVFMHGPCRDVKCPGIKCYGVIWFTPKDEIIIIVHHKHRNMQKRSCGLSNRFYQYFGPLGLYAWISQGCQMSRSKRSWQQIIGHQIVYSQRRDNHHRAPRTPQHAEKVLQTQHPLLSIYWAQGRRKVR